MLKSGTLARQCKRNHGAVPISHKVSNANGLNKKNMDGNLSEVDILFAVNFIIKAMLLRL